MRVERREKKTMWNGEVRRKGTVKEDNSGEVKNVRSE